MKKLSLPLCFLIRLQSFLRRLQGSLYSKWLTAQGAVIGCRVVFHPGVDIPLRHPSRGGGYLELGDECEISRYVSLHPYQGRIVLGKSVFLGPNVVIYGHGGVEIGENSLIAMHCRIVSSEHHIPGMDDKIRFHQDLLKPTHIGQDVWLGAGVTVLGGVTIGDGCVVGAGAVVAKDLPAGSIAMGVPARVTSMRSRAARA